MQKEIKDKVLITALLGVIFTGVALLIYFLIYTKGRSPWVLFTVALFLIVGIGAFLAMFGVKKEAKIVDKEFFPIFEARGSDEVLSLAQKLEKRLQGTFFEVETNDDGLRVLEGLDDDDQEQMAAGKLGIAEGFIYLKTSNPNKYTEIPMEMECWLEDGQVKKRPILVGGKKIDFNIQVEIDKDEEGNLRKIQNTNYGSFLAQIIRDSKKEDGWSTSLDATSKYGLAMGVLGLGGAIVSIISLLVQKFM